MPELPFLDSAKHYAGSDGTQKWTTFGDIALGQGRRGGPCISTQNYTSFMNGISKTFRSEYARLVVGVARRDPGTVIGFKNDNNRAFVQLVSIGDGRLKIDGTDMTISAWGYPLVWGGGDIIVGPIKAGWNHFGLDATVTPVGVTINHIYINDQDFFVARTADFAHPERFKGGGWATVFMNGGLAEDVCVSATAFYGDCYVDALHTTANGDSAMWTPNPAVAGWMNVSDATPDGDATTVGSTEVGDLNLYVMEPATPSNIQAFQGVVSFRKDTAGLAAIKLAYKSGSAITLTEDEYYPALTYSMALDGIDDDTLVAAVADHALQFGHERTK